MNRNLPIVLVLIAVVALAFVVLNPRGSSNQTQTNPNQPTPAQSPSSPGNATPPGSSPENPATASGSGPVLSPRVVTVKGQPRTLEGALDLDLIGERLRLAVLVNSKRVADVPIQNGKFRLELPGTLSDMPMSNLVDLPLPNGDGRLQGNPDVLGARALIFAYEDTNNNQRLDEGEPSGEGVLSRANQDPNLRGFFRNQLYVLSGPARLKDTRDSSTGAKDYFRYDLSLNAGWHVLQGEFVSNGYDVREATGSNWDVSAPLTPKEPGPGGFEPR